MAVDLVTRLTLKNQQFQNSLNQSKQQVRDFKRSVSDNSGIKNLQVSFTNLARGINTGNASLTDFAGSLSGISAGIGVAVGVLAAAGTAIYAIGSKAIDARKEMESMEISFSVLTGSMERSKQLVGEMKALGAISPIQTADIAKAGQTLMGFGTDASNVMPILRQLSDIAMGDTQRFQSLALAYAQMSATGKLMGQDLNQMINAGFNPLQIISEKTGKSIGQLKEEMSQGKISSQDVAQAFADATAEGGKFAGMTEKLGKSLNGMFNQQQDKINQQWAELGEKIAPEVIKSMDLINEAIDLCFDSMEEIFNVVKEVDDTFKQQSGVSYFDLMRDALSTVLKLIKAVFAVFGLLYKILGKIASYVAGSLVRYFGKLYDVIKPVVDLLLKLTGDAFNTIDNAVSSNKGGKKYKVGGRILSEGDSYTYQYTKNGQRREVTKGIKNGKLVTITDREISNARKINSIQSNTNKTIRNTKKNTIDQEKIYKDTLDDLKLQSNELEDIKSNINLINMALNQLPRVSVYRNNLEKILNQQLGKKQKIEVEYLFSQDYYEKNISELQDRLSKINPDTDSEAYSYLRKQLYQFVREYRNLIIEQRLFEIGITEPLALADLKNARSAFLKEPSSLNLLKLGEARYNYINIKLPNLQDEKEYAESELNMLQQLYSKTTDLHEDYFSSMEDDYSSYSNGLMDIIKDNFPLSDLVKSKDFSQYKEMLEQLQEGTFKASKKSVEKQFQMVFLLLDKYKSLTIDKLQNLRKEIENVTGKPYSVNSLNDFSAQLQSVQDNINNFGDALKFGKSPFDINFSTEDIKAVQEQYKKLYEIHLKLQLLQLSTDPKAGISLAANFGLNTDLFNQLTTLYTLMKSNADIAAKTAAAFGLAGQMMGSLGSAFQNSGLSKAALVASAIGNILLGFAQASAESGKKGMIYWIAATLSGLATVASVIGQMKSYSTGGIIQGNSTHGDQIMARVNAGEMILNPRQQGNLFDMLNSGITGGNGGTVEFKIKGDTLYGVLNNYNRIHGKIK